MTKEHCAECGQVHSAVPFTVDELGEVYTRVADVMDELTDDDDLTVAYSLVGQAAINLRAMLLRREEWEHRKKNVHQAVQFLGTQLSASVPPELQDLAKQVFDNVRVGYAFGSQQIDESRGDADPNAPAWVNEVLAQAGDVLSAPSENVKPTSVGNVTGSEDGDHG